MMNRTMARRGLITGSAIVAAAALGTVAAPAAFASQSFTIAGVSCTLHSETNGEYNSMFCSTSQSYHFSSQACRTSCTTLGSNTAANNRLVHICAPSGSGLSNSLTVYFGSSNKGTYTVARNSIPPVPC